MVSGYSVKGTNTIKYKTSLQLQGLPQGETGESKCKVDHFYAVDLFLLKSLNNFVTLFKTEFSTRIYTTHT